MLTNSYFSPTTSTSKRKRDAFDLTANFDITRSLENDFKKPRSMSFDSRKTLSLDIDNTSPFSSPQSSPFKASNNNSPFKANNNNSPFKANNNSPFKANTFTSHPLNASHSSPFKGNMSTNFYAFDDNKLLEWIPKSKRKLHLSSTKSDRIFTKDNAIKETKHNHSILCDKELQVRLGEQQGTFEKIVAKENNNNNDSGFYSDNNNNNNNNNNNIIHNGHNRNSNFDYMS